SSPLQLWSGSWRHVILLGSCHSEEVPGMTKPTRGVFLLMVLLAVPVLLDPRVSPTSPPEEVVCRHAQVVEAIAFSTDGKTLASVGETDLYLWDLRRGKLRDRLQAKQLTGAGRCANLTFSPDGRTLASVHWRTADLIGEPQTVTIHLWDVHQ